MKGNKLATDLPYHLVSIDSLPLPVILISSKRTLLAANNAAVAVFDKLQIGSDLAEMMNNPSFLDHCSKTLEDGEHHECEIVRKRVAKRRFQANINPYEYAGGRGAFIVFYETTAAHEAEKMRSSFVADVSHELRSPLTTMIATIETLKGSAGDKPDVRARFTDLLADETNRMHRIVDDLLSLSATEANEHIRPEDPVGLAPIIASVAEALKIKAESKGMTIALDIDEGLAQILGDRDELYQVIYNLADNAVKYGPEKSTVRLSAKNRGRSVTFSTLNFGTKILKEHLPRLTERFYRADKEL